MTMIGYHLFYSKLLLFFKLFCNNMGPFFNQLLTKYNKRFSIFLIYTQKDFFSWLVSKKHKHNLFKFFNFWRNILGRNYHKITYKQHCFFSFAKTRKMEMHRDKMAVHAQKVIRRGAIDHSLSSFKDIKDLQPSGILGTFVFPLK